MEPDSGKPCRQEHRSAAADEPIMGGVGGGISN
jgi:hypothetical protein